MDSVKQLRLTPFERYMMLDERAGYPMSFPMIWHVTGDIDKGLFNEAFQQALTWHPLLRGRVGKSGWTWDDTVTERVCFPSTAGSAENERFVDCHLGPMVCCEVVGETQCREIHFAFHHVATDGVSAAEFCGDVFGLYAQRMGKLTRKIRCPDSQDLANRSVLDRAVAEPVSTWTATKFLTRETLIFLSRRAEAVRGDQCEQNPSVLWQIASRRLDRATSRRVIETADGLDATLNDWAMVALMRTIAKWNDQHTERRGNGWLVANMPVHMRPRNARKTSASNAIGYSFLARKRTMLKDLQASVGSVAEETKTIQKWKLGGMFVDAIAKSFRFPGAMRLATSRLLQPASFVLSNIGDPSRRFRTRLPRNADGNPLAGNLTILGVIGAAPTRPGTELTASVSSIAGELSLTIRLTPRLFSAAACEQLVDLWKDEMLREI